MGASLALYLALFRFVISESNVVDMPCMRINKPFYNYDLTS